MSGRPRRVHALDVVIFVGVAAALLTLALLSPSLVPRGAADGVTRAAPPIERRDQLYGTAVQTGSVIWAAGNDGKILHSDDCGGSWSVQSVPTEQNLQGIAAWDGEHAVAVGDGGVVATTSDGGASWKMIDAPRSDVANKLMRVLTAPGGRAWAVGVMGAVLETGDWGETWRRVAEEQDVAWNGVAFADEQNGWIVGEFGRILHSRDGGETWEEVPSPVQRSLMSVAFRDPEHGVAVGLDGLVLWTDDGGTAWAEVPAGTSSHLFDVIWDGTRWVAVGDMGVLATSGPESPNWTARRLAEHELGWHTAVVSCGGALFLAGSSQGHWRNEAWEPWSPTGQKGA